MLNPMPPLRPPVPATKFQANFNVRFPPLPRTTSEVTRLLSEDEAEPNLEQLIEIVHADPIVTQLVLRRINSAYYGLQRRVTEVQKAIALLGFIEVSNIVLTAAMLQLQEAVSNPEQEHIFKNLMRLSIGGAIYAQRLAQWLHLPFVRRVFTAGLLHVSGRLILLYNRPDDYEALWYTTEKGSLPPADAERTIFGVSYLELNERAANEWNLPEELGLVLGKLDTPKELPTPELQIQAALVATGSAAAEQLHLAYSSTVQLPDQSHLLLGYTLTAAQIAKQFQTERDDVERYLHMLLNGNGHSET